MMNLSTNMRAVLLVLFCFGAYNIADAFLNGVVDYYHFGSVGFYPLLSYLVLFLIFSKRLGGLGQIPKTTKLTLHLSRSFLSLLGFIGFIFAVKYISLAQTYTLILASPIWVALISFLFLKHTIGLNRWITIIIGFTGVIIAMQPDSNGVHIASLGALICGLCAAGIMLIARKIGEKEPMVNLIFYPISITVIALAIMNTVWLGWEPILKEHIIFFAIAGTLFLTADILFSKGFAMGETSLLAPLHYSQILWGALIGYFFFNETPEIWTYIGAAIIVGSGIYLIHREHKLEKALTQTPPKP